MEANNINRRKFLKITGLSSAMLAVGFESLAFGEDSKLQIMMAEDFVEGTALNPFVIISEEGSINIMAHIPELGQGIFKVSPPLLLRSLKCAWTRLPLSKPVLLVNTAGSQLVVAAA